MDSKEIAQARNTIWDFLQLHTEFPDEVDLILVIGSRDDRVALFASDMSHHADAKLIVLTGGPIHHRNWLTEPKWSEPTEAEHFAAVMKQRSAKPELLLEKTSTNIGDKIKFTEKLLREKGFQPKSVLIISALYMERRVLKTFTKYWTYGTPQVYISSTRETFNEYVNHIQSEDVVTNIMVGEMDRILKYPAKGFMDESGVPEFVEDAYKLLKSAGYTKLLL
jgi:uncharacterized SAM-binding protein YcdF (DUF218 family)